MEVDVGRILPVTGRLGDKSGDCGFGKKG